jgi:hypothetical protein
LPLSEVCDGGLKKALNCILRNKGLANLRIRRGNSEEVKILFDP